MLRYISLTSLLLLAVAAGCSEPRAAVELPIRPVKTMTVSAATTGKQWTFAGTAEDALETDLSFRVGGKIVAFPGDQIGRRFAKGEVIARLDPADFDLQLRQAQANMEQVRANYIRAKADLERNNQLFARSVISRGELDQIEADFKSFEAQLNASAKQLDIARKQLGYTTLHAPFDGWIGRVQANIHQNVAGGQSVASFNAGRQMKMYIAVPDRLIGQVFEGDEVEVRFDALPGRTMQGTVMEVSVDATGGSTYPVKVYLENTDNLVRSGMSGHVVFHSRTNGDPTYFLPPVAVVGNPDGTRFIWVVDAKTSTVARRTVTVGRLSATGLEITDGVQAGDIVVIRGVHRLKDGLRIRFDTPKAEG